MIFQAIQVLVALILLFIIYMITLAILSVDAIVTDKTKSVVGEKEVTTVIDGYAGPAMLKDLTFNTINPYASQYTRINRSVNKTGGASFTYQFWLKVEEANDELFKNKVIFTKGDPRKFMLAYFKLAENNTQYERVAQLPANPYIACPMIQFGESYREFKVYFNTNNDIVTYAYVRMDANDESSSRKNLLSMMPMRWMLFTFVLEDNYSFVDTAENGIKFTMYVNDIPYWSESASRTPVLKHNTLKQNDGDIIFAPEYGNTSEFFKIGNFKYYNYAVTSNDVISVFKAGPPTYGMKESKSAMNQPGFITAVNKLDIYNY
jgi:hypothetical protein